MILISESVEPTSSGQSKFFFFFHHLCVGFIFQSCKLLLGTNRGGDVLYCVDAPHAGAALRRLCSSQCKHNEEFSSLKGPWSQIK